MPTPTLLIINAAIVTVDPGRRVIHDGYVAITGQRITGVGLMAEAPEWADRVIDARGKAILPGFINTHTHSNDVLLRGGVADDRILYDWLLNIGLPAGHHYELEDFRTAVKLFTLDALRSGITTIVDQIENPFERWDEIADVVVDSYIETGVRAVVAQMFYDKESPEAEALMGALMEKNPEIEHDLGAEPGKLDEMLATIEGMIQRHHGREDGRISFWPAPGVAILCTADALRGAQQLARKYDVMTTVHVAESPIDANQSGMSSVQYLGTIGYLDDRALLGHCVQLSTNDIRVLSASGAHVSTQPASNLFLGNGIARVAEMQTAGITVGIGTDDSDCNNGVNMIRDLRLAALLQKGLYKDPAAITAEKVIEMATIDGARAIGMENEIGSIEEGKKADLLILDLSASHLVPRQSIASALVYQALGNEVETVIVDGTVVFDDGQPVWLDGAAEAVLLKTAQMASDRIIEAAGLPERSDSLWVSRRVI